jgi:hypothetical protein
MQPRATAAHLQRRVVDEGKQRWQIQEVAVVMLVVAYEFALRIQLGRLDDGQSLGCEWTATSSLVVRLEGGAV